MAVTMKNIIILFLFLFLAGCSSLPNKPAYEAKKGARVGFISNIGNTAHLNTYMVCPICSFIESSREVDWDLNATTFNAFKNELESDGDFSLVPINLSDQEYSYFKDSTRIVDSNMVFTDGLEDILRKYQNNLDIEFVIFISERDDVLLNVACDPFGNCRYFRTKGYGLSLEKSAVLGLITDTYSPKAVPGFKIDIFLLNPLVNLAMTREYRNIDKITLIPILTEGFPLDGTVKEKDWLTVKRYLEEWFQSFAKKTGIVLRNETLPEE